MQWRIVKKCRILKPPDSGRLTHKRSWNKLSDMRKGILFLAPALIMIFFSCRKETPVYPPLAMDEISGDRLWQRIAHEENYHDYPEWPGLEGLQRGQSPHGRYHEIYIHSLLRNALPIADRTAPDGSVIVKENFDADKVKTGYTVMAKVKGYDPEHADWFWASFDAAGKTLAAGKLGMCIDCHTGKKDNDYVIVRPLELPFVAETE